MSKYLNIKTVVDGIRFDSKAEARRWQELKLLERAGEIARLERQTSFKLTVNGIECGKYVADFQYVTTKVPIERVVEDVKGQHTAKLPMFIMKRKLMRAVYGIDVRVVS